MVGLIEPTPRQQTDESNFRPVLIGVVIVAVVLGILVLVFRVEHKPPSEPPAYSANVKFSDSKASGAQNFVGATVSYLDGTVTNTGDKTVIHAVVQVTFQ